MVYCCLYGMCVLLYVCIALNTRQKPAWLTCTGVLYSTPRKIMEKVPCSVKSSTRPELSAAQHKY